MDLKKMVEDAEMFTEIYNELNNLINEYLEKYDTYKSKYSSKKYEWIRGIIEEFKEVYEGHGFEVKEDNKCYDMGYEKSCYLKYTAVFKNLEFELIGSGEKRADKSIRFLQTKPESAAFNYELHTNIKEYKIGFDIYEKDKYSEKKIHIFNLKQISDLKKEINSTKYSVDEMKVLLSIFKDEKEKLERDLKEIADNDFIGYIYKDKVEIEFDSLANLIKVL